MLKPSTLTILLALVSPYPGLRQMSLPKRGACVLSALGDRRVGMEAEGGLLQLTILSGKMNP